MKALLALRSVGFCVGQRQMCLNVRWAFFFCPYAAKIPLAFCRLFCFFTMNANLFVYSYSSNPLYQMCCVCSCFVYISKSFNGFFMFFKLLILTWVYISVVLDDLCPSNSCIYLKSVPLSSK